MPCADSLSDCGINKKPGNMSSDQTPLSKGLLFGSVTGLFGGSFWALIVSSPPDEALIAPRWIVIGGGFLLWFFVGFLVGVFNAPRSTNEIALQAGARFSLLRRMVGTVGWFLYRLIVGYFIGMISTVVFSLIGIAPWFAVLVLIDPDKKLMDRPEVQALLGAQASSVYSSISGGIFGALLVSRRSAAVRSTLGWRVVRGSFLGFLCGILFGAALGWLPPEEKNIFVHLAASIPIGILAGILGGLWTEVRNIQDGRKD